jgi:mannose/cellobiose epimerase-like protein (N-acyl-D-glucosamine 2-epimerase family)
VPVSSTAATDLSSGVAESSTSTQISAVPGFKLDLPADSWKQHVEKQLMPFWTMASAQGKSKTDPFPTYRCNDGAAYGDPGCDFSSIKKVNKEVRTENKKDGLLEWVSGPRNELFKRQYVRMHSRQTYAYGVAYHLTGNPEYLKLARRGVLWLLANAIDKENGGSYTFMENGKGKPSYKFRTSQDQSYTLLGLAFYHYLTHDPEVFKVLTQLKNDILKTYQSPAWEGGQLIKWMLKTKQEPKPTCRSTIPAPDKGTTEQKELVALLDQVNAYLLLTTQTAPAEARSSWLRDLHTLAETIRDRFYNDGEKSKNQAKTGISPIVPPGMFAGCLTYKGPLLPKKVPACSPPDYYPAPLDPENCDPSSHHTDFGHSIKSFWMLYLIGREADDKAMVQFGEKGAHELFKRAFYDKDGSWARAYQLRPDQRFDPNHAKLDTNKEWWIYAELDQMAATLALVHPETMVHYLNKTYKYWLEHFVTRDGEVVQWVYDPACDPTKPRSCDNELIPKANLWKNAFHSTEHGLVAYITTAEINHTPATLYYALVTKELPKLQPYYYRAAKVSTVNEGTIEDAGVTYQKVRADFSEIR